MLVTWYRHVRQSSGVAHIYENSACYYWGNCPESDAWCSDLLPVTFNRSTLLCLLRLSAHSSSVMVTHTFSTRSQKRDWFCLNCVWFGVVGATFLPSFLTYLPSQKKDVTSGAIPFLFYFIFLLFSKTKLEKKNMYKLFYKYDQIIADNF